MNAGTKVILQYRLIKRLGKIKELLGTCRDKKEVRKLVENSHAKAIDQEQGIYIPVSFTLYLVRLRSNF